MIFLITGSISTRAYASETVRSRTVTRLVEADTSELASQKFVRKMEEGSDPYCITIKAYVAEVSEMIV